jgi:hypothetical protein
MIHDRASNCWKVFLNKSERTSGKMLGDGPLDSLVGSLGVLYANNMNAVNSEYFVNFMLLYCAPKTILLG